VAKFLTDLEISELEKASLPSEEPTQEGFLSDQDIARLEKEEIEYDRPFAAGLAGAARGASFGLSDVALTQTGLVEPETLRKLEEYNPIASTGSEVAAVVAPLLLSGGTGLLAKGVQTAGKGVIGASKAGLAVEKAVAKQFVSDASKSTAKKVLESGLATGAGSAVEGAIYGGGQLISELAIGEDTDLTAEKVLSTIGLSTVLSGGLGGALGAIRPAAPSLLRKAQSATNRAFTGLNDLTGGALDSAAQGVAKVASKFSGQDEEVLKDLLKKPFQKEGAAGRRLATLPQKEAEERVLELTNILDEQYTHMEDVASIVNQTIRPLERKTLFEPIPAKELELIFNPGPKAKAEIEAARKVFVKEEERKLSSFLKDPEIKKEFLLLQQHKANRNAAQSSKAIKTGVKAEVLSDYALVIEQLETSISAKVPEFKVISERLGTLEALERKLSFYGVTSKGVSEKKIQNLLLNIDDPAVSKTAKNFQAYNELLGIDTGKLGQKVKDLIDSGIEDPVEQMTRIQNSAINLRNKTKAAINEMRREPDLFAPSVARKLEIALSGMDTRLDDSVTPFQMFNAIDDTKKAIDDFAKFGRNVTSEEEGAINRLREVRRAFKDHLENPVVYGPAAVAQQSVNAKLSSFYQAKEAFKKEFMVKSVSKSGAIEYKIAPIKVNSYSRNVDSANNSIKDDVLLKYLDSSKGLLGEVDEISTMTPEISELVKNNPILSRGGAPNEAFTKHIQNLIEQASKRSDLKTLKSGEGLGLSPADILTGAVSYAVGGPLGIGIVYGLKLLNNPGNLVEGLAALERMTMSVNKRISSSLNGFVKNVAGATEKVKAKVELSAVTGSQISDKSDLSKLITPVSVTILGNTSFNGKRSKSESSRQEAYKDRMEELARLSSNPYLVAEILSKNLYAISTVAPKVNESMVMQAMTGLQYIYEAAPKNPGLGMFGKRPWNPSDFQLAKWERTVVAVLDPLSVLDDLKKGTLTHEAVNAIEAVYPKLYAEIQGLVMEKASALNEELPYAKRIQLSILFKVPLDDVMKPNFINMLQNNFMVSEPQDGQNASGIENLELSGSRETQIERIQNK